MPGSSKAELKLELTTPVLLSGNPKRLLLYLITSFLTKAALFYLTLVNFGRFLY